MALGANVHYVKFVRGSIQAWETLLEMPNKISDDTLYFIYESTNNSAEGKLYLGQKLISGTGTGGNSGIVNINDIGDIYIDNDTLADKQILVYNHTSEQWENTSLSTIINTAVGDFTGATSVTAGSAGLVPAPQAGDENKFLSGSGGWATINLPSFDPNVFQANSNNVITLIGLEQATVGSIPTKTNAGIEWAPISAAHTLRSIVTMAELEELVEEGAANENTIYMVASTIPGNDNSYDEYLIVSGQIELIGTIGEVDLTDYVTQNTFDSAIGDLNTLLYGTSSGGVTTPGLLGRVNFLQNKVGDLNSLILSQGNTTLVDEVNSMHNNINLLSERLQWQELNEE